MALKDFFDTLEINPDEMEISNGEYQTSLKPSSRKVTLHCQEIDKFHNEIDSQPSTPLFPIDVKDDEVHYAPLNPIYFPLLSTLQSFHLTLLDKNH